MSLRQEAERHRNGHAVKAIAYAACTGAVTAGADPRYPAVIALCIVAVISGGAAAVSGAVSAIKLTRAIRAYDADPVVAYLLEVRHFLGTGITGK